ncbi:unnamed protein product, partial [Hapterophycus canaliculatus]
MSARRSARLSPGNTSGEKASKIGSEEARRDTTLVPNNKRPRRAAPTETAAAASAASAADGGDASPAKHEETEAVALEEGPSAYELQRLAKIKENAMMMAALGLGGATGKMRAAVNNDAAQRAKARGLGPRVKPKGYPARTRESARVRGKSPEGLPMEDPEDAFNRKRESLQDAPEAARAASPSWPRMSGDVSMEASNTSEDGTLRLRQMMGGLVGRYDRAGDQEDYDLAEPDDVLKRLRNLKVEETGVCKVVRERAYSMAWHPSKEKLLLAVGDKVGNVGLWAVDEDADSDAAEGVFEFKPHTGAVPRMTFDPLDGNKIISTSYDGTVRRMEVEKGTFEQVFGNNAGEDAFLTDGHLVAEDRLMLLSDADGDITALDLRTNTKARRQDA